MTLKSPGPRIRKLVEALIPTCSSKFDAGPLKGHNVSQVCVCRVHTQLQRGLPSQGSFLSGNLQNHSYDNIFP